MEKAKIELVTEETTVDRVENMLARMEKVAEQTQREQNLIVRVAQLEQTCAMLNQQVQLQAVELRKRIPDVEDEPRRKEA